MDNNRFVLTQRDMKRNRLLQMVVDSELTLVRVTPALGVSYRQARRLMRKLEDGGPGALAHGNRGRDPANKLDQELRDRVIALSTDKYSEYNDSHFAEILAREHGIFVSREVVRRWRREAGIKPKRSRRQPKHRSRRERKAAAGMMVQWDGSPHRWFGPDYPPCCLMAAVDDATGEIVAAFLLPRESSWGYLRLLELIIMRWGVPCSIYHDRHSALHRSDDNWTHEEELAGRQDPTQVGASLQALGITAIPAGSPQAKGRIERLFGTLQDRLVAELRTKGITDIAAANAYLENEFLDRYNQTFSVAPESPESAWRKAPPAQDLELALSLSYTATVANDNAVRLGDMVIDIPPGPRGMSYAKAQVRVLQLLDGSWRVYYGAKLVATAPTTEIAELIRTRRRRRGMKGVYDPKWVNQASAPDMIHHEPVPKGAKSAPNAKLAKRTPSSLRPGPVRRAGPGRTIKGTRIA